VRCFVSSLFHLFGAQTLQVSEITLSRLNTQWGFNDTTPVEAGDGFAYAGILIKELCTSRS
jgi:hypothetical protein